MTQFNFQTTQTVANAESPSSTLATEGNEELENKQRKRKPDGLITRSKFLLSISQKVILEKKSNFG